MSFCYEGHCPTNNDTRAACDLGKYLSKMSTSFSWNSLVGRYGLTALNASQASKTVSQLINSTDLISNELSEQKLSFYYYFTVPEDQENRGQQIQISIESDNDLSETKLLATITVANMTNYEWKFTEITFLVTWKVYTVNDFP